MAANWPVSLPTEVYRDQYQDQAEDDRLKFEVESGPAKTRSRTSIEQDLLRIAIGPLTRVQTATLDTFRRTTLIRGTLPFNFTHPRTGVTLEFYFDGTIQYSPAGIVDPATSLEMWIASFVLRQEHTTP